MSDKRSLWYGGELPKAPSHLFYQRLTEVLANAKFDLFLRNELRQLHHDNLGRPPEQPDLSLHRAQRAVHSRVRRKRSPRCFEQECGGGMLNVVGRGINQRVPRGFRQKRNRCSAAFRLTGTAASWISDCIESENSDSSRMAANTAVS